MINQPLELKLTSALGNGLAFFIWEESLPNKVHEHFLFHNNEFFYAPKAEFEENPCIARYLRAHSQVTQS